MLTGLRMLARSTGTAPIPDTSILSSSLLVSPRRLAAPVRSSGFLQFAMRCLFQHGQDLGSVLWGNFVQNRADLPVSLLPEPRANSLGQVEVDFQPLEALP